VDRGMSKYIEIGYIFSVINLITLDWNYVHAN